MNWDKLNEAKTDHDFIPIFFNKQVVDLYRGSFSAHCPPDSEECWLEINNLTISHSGVYRCTDNGGHQGEEKAFVTVEVVSGEF